MGIGSMITKKILIAFDFDDSNSKLSDFLIPVFEEGSPKFFGLKSCKSVDFGMMVYIGRDVTPNDLFAKLVGTGRKIENVDKIMQNIEEYLRMLQNYKIGNILAIEASPTETTEFQLKKIANTPQCIKKNLP